MPARIASFGGLIEIPWKKEFVLDCIVVGLPEANVQWSFNGSQVYSGGKREVSKKVSINHPQRFCLNGNKKTKNVISQLLEYPSLFLVIDLVSTTQSIVTFMIDR